MKKRRSNKHYLLSTREKVILGIVFVLLLLYALSLIYPFVFLLINSFKEDPEFLNDPLGFPKTWVTSSYEYAFTEFIVYSPGEGTETGLLGMFWNSISLSIVETIVSMFFTCCAAYVLAKYKFFGNKFLYSFIIVSSVVPTIAAIAATYKLMANTELIGHFIGMIILECGAFGGGFLYIHSYFKSIPWTFAESAMMDGASDFKIFWRIMIPMAKNGILTFTIMRFLGYWNGYWMPFLFYSNHPTLAVGLSMLSANSLNHGAYTELFAAMIVSIVPVIIFYAIFQKQLLSNTIDGGLK